MKRLSSVALAGAAITALMLSGCSSEEPTEASGLRKNTATGQAASTTTPDSDTTDETPAPEENTEGSDVPEQSSAATQNPASGRASDTTCGQFAQLDEPKQQQLVQRILDENPDSAFTGNPNAALGTAKLVCNAEKLADQRVAVVSGIVVNG